LRPTRPARPVGCFGRRQSATDTGFRSGLFKVGRRQARLVIIHPASSFAPAVRGPRDSHQEATWLHAQSLGRHHATPHETHCSCCDSWAGCCCGSRNDSSSNCCSSHRHEAGGESTGHPTSCSSNGRLSSGFFAIKVRIARERPGSRQLATKGVLTKQAIGEMPSLAVARVAEPGDDPCGQLLHTQLTTCEVPLHFAESVAHTTNAVFREFSVSGEHAKAEKPNALGARKNLALGAALISRRFGR